MADKMTFDGDTLDALLFDTAVHFISADEDGVGKLLSFAAAQRVAAAITIQEMADKVQELEEERDGWKESRDYWFGVSSEREDKLLDLHAEISELKAARDSDDQTAKSPLYQAAEQLADWAIMDVMYYIRVGKLNEAAEVLGRATKFRAIHAEKIVEVIAAG